MIDLLLAGEKPLLWPIVLPLAGAVAAFLRPDRPRLPGLLAASLTALAGLVLCLHLARHGATRVFLGGWPPPLGISLRADGPAVLMVMMTAVTGLAVSVYAGGYFQSRMAREDDHRRHARQEQSFWPLWLVLWGALNGLFLSGDLFNIYVTLELVALSSVGLTALSGKPASQIAAMRYLLVSLLGSLSFLLGVAFLYKAFGRLDLAAIQTGGALVPAVAVALGLLTVGLLLKSALFPFHFWLPPAHANALAPVSALLSALVVKGGWYVFFRLWQNGAGPTSGVVLAALGGGALVWGGYQAFCQQRLKMLVAYSTVAQIGFLFLLFSLPGSAAAMFSFALSHSCAKGAMFLAAGTILVQLGHDRVRDLDGVRQLLPKTAFAFALGGLSLMGLPPTGGFLAKYLALSLAISHQQWWLAAVMVLGSGLTVLYVARAVAHILSPRPAIGAHPVRVAAAMEWSALILALVALLLGLLAPFFLGLLEVVG
jgi:formate hydrogenlyase subunit 3/multisubunit Na+/H+ antiporter MnhD subunit